MNYTEITDFEINKAVGEIILEGKWACKPGCAGNQSDSWYYGSVDTFVTPYPELPDYCSSWDDTGPVIEKNKICIMAYAGRWTASAENGAFDYISFSNENPRRAAMIVFLMMQESENA